MPNVVNNKDFSTKGALSEENSEYLKRCGFAWSDPKKP